MTRTREVEVNFGHPFEIPGYKGALPAGRYRLEVEEEPVGNLPFPAYRRTQVILHLRHDPNRPGISEMLALKPETIDAALARDRRQDLEARPGRTPTQRSQEATTMLAIQYGEDEGMLWVKDTLDKPEKDERAVLRLLAD